MTKIRKPPQYPRGTAQKVAAAIGLHIATVRKVLQGQYTNQKVLDEALKVAREKAKDAAQAHATRQQIAEVYEQTLQLLNPVTPAPTTKEAAEEIAKTLYFGKA
jgi:DNA-binding protein Fis